MKGGIAASSSNDLEPMRPSWFSWSALYAPNATPQLPDAQVSRAAYAAFTERKLHHHEGLVDLQKFDVQFVSRNFLKDIVAPQGRVNAAASVPVSAPIVGRGLQTVEVARLNNGKIPIRVDGRLLRNLPDLRNSIRHEVGEIEFLLRHEGRAFESHRIQEIFSAGHQRGLQSEIPPRF